MTGRRWLHRCLLVTWLAFVASVGVDAARSSDGTNDWALTNTAVNWLNGSNGPWTIVFWVKSGSTSQTNTYLMSRIENSGGNQMAVIYEFTDNAIEFYCPDCTGTDPRTSSGVTISDTNWHHVAYRKNNSGTSAYDKFLDGTKTSINASIDFTLPGGTDYTSALFGAKLGVSSGGGVSNEVNAALAEVAFIASSVSDGNIANLASGSTSLATLVGASDAYYPLCGTASPEPDQGSNAWNLTVSGPIQATHPPGIASPCSSASYVPRRLLIGVGAHAR